jgi:hypothetical protein
MRTMHGEMISIIGPKVDLVEKESPKNPIRRQHILTGRQPCFPLGYVDRNACYAEISGLLRSRSRLT